MTANIGQMSIHQYTNSYIEEAVAAEPCITKVQYRNQFSYDNLVSKGGDVDFDLKLDNSCFRKYFELSGEINGKTTSVESVREKVLFRPRRIIRRNISNEEIELLLDDKYFLKT